MRMDQRMSQAKWKRGSRGFILYLFMIAFLNSMINIIMGGRTTGLLII